MNYITLSSTPLGYIFDNIFNKHHIPVELRIIIFGYLKIHDISHYFGNFNICVELDCLFNKKTLDQHHKLDRFLKDKLSLIKTQINSLCFNCTNQEDETLLISLTRQYTKYLNQDLINKQFFDKRVKFYTHLKNGSYISKYYECVNGFSSSEIIKKRRNRRIASMCKRLEYNWAPRHFYDFSKKYLQKILETNNVKYYKSWTKKRLINAYYQNV